MRGDDRAVLTLLHASSLQTEVDTLLASISSYIANPSFYTQPARLAERLLQISPKVQSTALRLDLERALAALSSVGGLSRSEPQDAKDALMVSELDLGLVE